jgi:hypothetical protein
LVPNRNSLRSHRPGKIVIDEKTARAPALNPRVVQTTERRKRGIRAAALKHDREGIECLLKVGGTEQALLP